MIGKIASSTLFKAFDQGFKKVSNTDNQSQAGKALNNIIRQANADNYVSVKERAVISGGQEAYDQKFGKGPLEPLARPQGIM